MCTAANFLLRHSTLFSMQSTLFLHFFICAPNDNNFAFLIIPSSTLLVRVKMALNAPVYELEKLQLNLAIFDRWSGQCHCVELILIYKVSLRIKNMFVPQ